MILLVHLRAKLLSHRTCAALGFDENVDGVGSAIPIVETNASVGELVDGAGNRAGQEVPPCGQNDRITWATKAAVKNEFISVNAIAGGCGVSFRNAQADRLSFLHWREGNQHHLCRWLDWVV